VKRRAFLAALGGAAPWPLEASAQAVRKADATVTRIADDEPDTGKGMRRMRPPTAA